MFYEIECQVSGGVTGTRTAMLKDASGDVRQFETRAEAEQEAASLTREMNGPNARARFRYTVVEGM